MISRWTVVVVFPRAGAMPLATLVRMVMRTLFFRLSK